MLNINGPKPGQSGTVKQSTQVKLGGEKEVILKILPKTYVIGRNC
jgi:hypothetical protein